MALSKDCPKTRYLLPLPIESLLSSTEALKVVWILPLPIESLLSSTEALQVVWILNRLQVNIFASDRSKYE